MEMMRMQRSTVLTAFQRAAAFFLAAVMVPAGWAQDASQIPSAPSAQMQSQQAVPSKSEPFDVKEYSKPRSAFPNLLAPYTARHVAPPNLANTPRIDQFLHDGKLYISMNDAVALALENNLDIAIARYNLNIADTDIWRAKAGSSILGVNSGVVQNTPGGGIGGLGTQVGSGQGGTSVAAGGAGTGTGGVGVSTLGNGPLIASFDPILTGTFQLDQNRSQTVSPFAPPFSDSHTSTWDFGYQEGFHWGTNLSVGFNNTRGTASPLSPFQPFTTQYNSNFRAQATQHLLQGFGFAPNTRFIQIAKNNREISDVAFRWQITNTVDQIENMYWDLVFAYENVRVQQEQLAFAQKTLSDNQKQVQIGTLAPIEVVRAQSTVATNQQTLTLALTNLQLQQLLMKNALSRTLVDPALADAEVIPTSTMELPAQEPIVPTQDLVNDALGHHPELAEARINLSNTDISNKAIRSALLPTVDLFAYYGGQGLGGDQNPSNLCVNQNPPIFGCSTKPAPSVGYSGGLNQLINSTAPDKGAGITVNIPLRNRAAQATQVRSEFVYRQAQLRIQQIENQIRIEVRNAQFGVQQNRASVASAQAALDLGRQSLDAEQKKYALGASTSTLVLQNQAAMTQAEVTLVSAQAAYEKAEVDLDRAIGLLLDHAGIQIADAERGEVTHAPNIPHVVARPADQPALAPPPPPAQPQQ